MLLNDNWFFEMDAQRVPVTLGHTWNAADGQTAGKDPVPGRPDGAYRRCRFCCTHTLTVRPADTAGPAYLPFEGVNAVAEVFVNGHLAGQHRGGYTAFWLDIAPFLHEGDNALAVYADNSPFADVAPLDADFTFYGGIYRDVHLYFKPPVHLAFLPLGRRALQVLPGAVSRQSGEVQLSLLPQNASGADLDARLILQVLDEETAVCTKTVPLHLPSGQSVPVRETLMVAQPHLWHGRKDPFLYTVHAALYVGGQCVDSACVKTGLRFYAVDRKKGFFLNGEAYPLRGVSRHQDCDGLGNALTRREHDEDFQILYDIGATAVRLAHYPQAEYFYDLCDAAGLVVWAEIPFVNSIGGSGSFEKPDAVRRAFFENVHTQLREMIRQNGHHAAICFWGVENEVHREYDAVMRPLMRSLYACAKAEDALRPVTHAVNIVEGCAWQSDLYAWNYYPGWYGSSRRLLGSFMDSQRRSRKKPLAISEYGAGGCTGQHTLSKKRPRHAGAWHPEEYQALCHESFVRQITRRPYLWATFVWNLFDFGCAARREGERFGINDKGLVTFDRKVKKDAYYVYKAAWSTEPVVYIVSRRFCERPAGKTCIKVYSNLPSLTLQCGAQSFALRAKRGAARPYVFEKTVRLARGENVVACASSDGSAHDRIVLRGV